jgi:DNA-binding response OmpR family regulator
MIQPINPSLRRPTVLVVESDSAVLAFIRNGLHRCGFTVRPAFSGMEAVQVLRSRPEIISLALIEHYFPWCDGFATLRALLRINPALPCCIMGSAIVGYEEEFRAAGAEWFLHKPFGLVELRACVEGLHDDFLPVTVVGR